MAIVHTPGHTAGSLCVLYDSAVFREVTYDDADKTTMRKKSERDGEDSSLGKVNLTNCYSARVALLVCFLHGSFAFSGALSFQIKSKLPSLEA